MHPFIKNHFFITITFCLLLLPITSIEAKMTTLKLPIIMQKTPSRPLHETLFKRRSIRSFKSTPLSSEQLSSLLWAAQGITQKAGSLRTAPSAGALYPLQLYIFNKEGVWEYIVGSHVLKQLSETDKRSSLAIVALGQSAVADAPVDIVITGIYARVTGKYGNRGIRYTHIEAGHAAQNILLEAVSLDLGAVPIGAFHDDKVSALLNLPKNETPLYIIPVGYAD